MVSRAVVAAIAENRNNWMPNFGSASHAIAAAVADGRISEEQIRAYPSGPGDGRYDPAASEALAAAAGYDAWSGDPEDIGIAVEAILALTVADAGIGEGTWYFHDAAELTDYGTTIEQLRDEVRGLSVVAAATLIIDADRYYREQAAR